jgi:predicted nucleic acid-binding protein
MSVVLIDTNIVSFLSKGDSRANEYAPHLRDRELAIAMMTVAELFPWGEMRQWGPVRRQQLEVTLSSYTMLPVDLATCRSWAEVRANRSALGRPISPQDAWVAATALRYRLSLITHNPADFEGITQLTVISEA